MFDCMFGVVVVVPRDSVVIEEGEQFTPVLCNALAQCRRNIRFKYLAHHFVEEFLNLQLVLIQVSCLQPEPINCRNYVPQQPTKLDASGSEACVKGIGQQGIIQVPDQVHEALLLGTFQRILSREEVRHQDALEILQEIMQE
jgi:hypothetical protein